MVPADVVNEAGVTVVDVREYLDHDEWEVALDLLADFDTGWRPPTAWWDRLIDSAEMMGLSDAAAWCRWGRWESIHKTVRAELRLLSPAEGGRQTPVPGKGILRPLWDIGRRTAAGDPDLLVARIWVESALALPPAATGSVRLGPLSPASGGTCSRACRSACTRAGPHWERPPSPRRRMRADSARPRTSSTGVWRHCVARRLTPSLNPTRCSPKPANGFHRRGGPSRAHAEDGLCRRRRTRTPGSPGKISINSKLACARSAVTAARPP